MLNWKNPASKVGIAELAAYLLNGVVTGRSLVEASLSAIDEADNCRKAFITINNEVALAQAARWDEQRRVGRPVPMFAGIPISVKDLFDVDGQITNAGSKILPPVPASRHATAIQRLTDAGFVILGRTHMTEFAYSGLGLNCHFADPDCVWNPSDGRVPGGSSSGAAIATALGAGIAGIGTDTGGSCRIPASFNRLVGFKPTARRIPMDGMIPLSPKLDSVGAIGRTVRCVTILTALMANEPLPNVQLRMPKKLLIPENYFFDGIDRDVELIFQRFAYWLESKGVQIEKKVVRSLDSVAALNRNGGIVAAESYSWHKTLLEKNKSDYDPRVLVRIQRGSDQTEQETAELYSAREAFIRDLGYELKGFDALLVPTTPFVPPRKADCIGDAEYTQINAAVLRNPMVANLADGCSITLPISSPDEPPIGAMLIGQSLTDSKILAWAGALHPSFTP